MTSAYDDPLGLQNNEAMDQMTRKVIDLNMAILAISKTQEGQTLLKFLREATIEAAAWSPSIALQYGIDAANAHAYAREGQNALVRDLESRIETAQNYTADDIGG